MSRSTADSRLVEPPIEPPILQTVTGGIVQIVLNRPHIRNAVDDEMCAAFDRAVVSAASDPDCRAIIVSGAGSVFCAGWDLRAITATRERNDPDDARRQFEANREVLNRYATVPQVTIALIHGAAVGFAVSLLARSDIVLAAPGTRISVPELSHGIVPAMVMRDVSSILPDKMARDWLLAGEVHDVDEAIRGGLVTRCVPGDLEAEGHRLARRIANLDPVAVRGTKALYQRMRQLDDREATTAAIEVAVQALTDGSGV
jgi:methylglutaconyl-CoA hydratase